QIAQCFSAGKMSCPRAQSCPGRKRTSCYKDLFSFVPAGTRGCSEIYPALKRWTTVTADKNARKIKTAVAVRVCFALGEKQAMDETLWRALQIAEGNPPHLRS